MMRVHLYGGPLDGADPEIRSEAKSLAVPQFGITYVFSEVWSCHFKRPTFISSGHKGPPPSRKEVAV